MSQRMTKPKVRKVKAWAVLDVQKKNPRLCYASMEEKEDKDSVGFVAITFNKPWIHWRWRPFKKIVRVTITYTLLKPSKKTNGKRT